MKSFSFIGSEQQSVFEDPLAGRSGHGFYEVKERRPIPLSLEFERRPLGSFSLRESLRGVSFGKSSLIRLFLKIDYSPTWECEIRGWRDFDNVSLKNTLLSLKSNIVKLFFSVFSCEALCGDALTVFPREL